MNLYITNTAYATETLINVIVHEEEELAGLRTEYVATQRQLPHLHQGIEFLALNPDLDDEGLGQLKRAEAWEVDNRARNLQAKIQDLTRSISDKEFSTTALCGSLLQIAKQGISTVHPRLDDCPPRPIGRAGNAEKHRLASTKSSSPLLLLYRVAIETQTA